ncbi:DNA-binding response regulator [Polaribacter sp. ALD11]|uniref:LytR/AlgR family response regulator transcription factor n=1 Tax=Polaribacter sp. ALD11 TaxID=2058137 RepID=UPI000C31A940|nr:LytTR family DNA-binding domain-containing protein [Polaribacter sp. ALD11]AUC84284.1 DNA-binding response regulator [Polaribacter sp. ALD11]
MYTVIIIDDEPLAIDVLTHYLKRFNNYKVAHTFTNPTEAFKYLNSNSIDLVFTDIAMPQISGIELVTMCKKHESKFILTTSYSEYAVESFDLDVVDYLLKPISLSRFNKAIERFEERVTKKESSPSSINKSSFFIKEGDEFIKIKIADIDYIEGMKDYAKIVTGNNFCMALKTLKSIEKLLESKQFLRIHKSFIVPLQKITQYNGKSVLINTHEVPVGNSYRSTLKTYLENNKL